MTTNEKKETNFECLIGINPSKLMDNNKKPFSLYMKMVLKNFVFENLMNKHFKKSTVQHYFKIASMPGNVFPSKLSNIAPPPVET